MEFTTEYLLEVLGPDAEAVFNAVDQLNKLIRRMALQIQHRSQVLSQAMQSALLWKECRTTTVEDVNSWHISQR